MGGKILPREERAYAFVEKARQIHGDKYSYCVDSYKGTDRACSIICHKHGVFTVSPANHLKGQGCSVCSGHKKMENQDFLIKSREFHGDRFDYSETKYEGANKPITYRCKKHNTFVTQRASHHISGGGYSCSECKKEFFIQILKWDNDKFISHAKNVHGEKYSYDKVEYDGTYGIIDIYCNACKKYFKQSASQHLRGRGCHSCGVLATKGACREAYKSERPASLYVLKLERSGTVFLKVGIAVDMYERVRRFKIEGNSLVSEVVLYNGPAKHIFLLETSLHRNLSDLKIRSDDKDWKLWSGYTECYPLEAEANIRDFVENHEYFNNTIIEGE